jgi:hypothetical protein
MAPETLLYTMLCCLFPKDSRASWRSQMRNDFLPWKNDVLSMHTRRKEVSSSSVMWYD